VVSGLVAAGGLAAALSTADGLLLTIANALSHDLYYKMIDPERADLAPCRHLEGLARRGGPGGGGGWRRRKPADILFLVSAAFSFAAATFFPPLVLGIFWKRANKWGRLAGHDRRPGDDLLLHGHDAALDAQRVRRHLAGRRHIWWGISPISAGVFGVPVGIAVIIVVSLLTRAPSRETQELVEHVRYPDLKLGQA
jgi:cation/acetate symporter